MHCVLECVYILRLWAQQNRDWAMDKWKNVSWSEESWFLIYNINGHVKIHHLPGKQLLSPFTARHKQAGDGNIMLWGTFPWTSLGPLVVVEQTMKALNYLTITADQLHPYMTSVFPIGNGIFQQDNTPYHKTWIVLESFKMQKEEF